MNCLSTEEIIAFVQHPLAADFAERAFHIHSCEACAKTFEMAIDAVSCKKVQVSSGDIQAAMRYLSKYRQKESLFARVEAALAKFCDKIKQYAEDVAVVVRSAVEMPQPAVNLNFRSSAAPQEESVRLTFEAYAETSSLDYWTARVLIPFSAADGKRIKIYCKDSQRKGIVNGSLSIFGAQLPVENGICEIDCETMRANLRSADVCFAFANGRKVRGHLKFD